MQERAAHAYPSIIESFAWLVGQRARLEEVVPFAMTERRILILVVACTGTICARDVQDVVRAFEYTSEHYDKVRRMIHHRVVYKQFRMLVSLGVLTRIRRGGRVWYRLRTSARRTLAPFLDELRPR